eukprot:TRINITY_DN4811_c0_g1_i1.p1 TRINITY_DN4811_c0_g1~~TRINITY_DN4811_c0_g1_i1.p1  ORF type:complete len:965 (+),score=116.25 TRINITY_DN4811_c0_g1_i1:51-2897(+)
MALPATYLFSPLGEVDFEKVFAVCIGTGRFLRAVLVPALIETGSEVIMAQTRGTSFCEYLKGRQDRTFEVDTVQPDGTILTACFPVAAAGSLGIAEGRSAFMQLPKLLPYLRFIGLGLTEAGLVHNGPSIVDLAEFLHGVFLLGVDRECPLSIVNTDNMPFNGDAIRKHVLTCDFTQKKSDTEHFQRWLGANVRFHNSMVDRITSHREGNSDVPRAEPLPAKVLVIEDLSDALPPEFGSVPGVVVRSERGQLEIDIALKLRIANGLHTAMVYVMALGRIFQTDGCIGHPDILPYLEQLFERDIVHVCAELQVPRLKATQVFSEWVSRLQHPHFGLACFFVCQNAMQKLGIRLFPSIKATLSAGQSPSPFMIFAIATMLRFLTPIGEQPRLHEQPPIFCGRLDNNSEEKEGATSQKAETWEYATGLRVLLGEGTYEFRDGDGIVPLLLRSLGREGGCNVAVAESLVADVLSRVDGFDARAHASHAHLATAVGQTLHRMLCGEPAWRVLKDLNPSRPIIVEESHLREAVLQEVEATEAVDVHTHLFPASYGPQLMQYGIDAMLTYHYLVAEYLSTAKELPDYFYSLPRKEKANRIWEALFVKASPISEQCRGVLTTLNALGLKTQVAARDLKAIRQWYAGQDADMFNNKMMRLAGLKYVVTTHDPFDRQEVATCLDPPAQPSRYRRALSLDSLLNGDWETVCLALCIAGKVCTLRGVAALLKRCVAASDPMLITATTPHDFSYEPTRSSGGGDYDGANLDRQLDTNDWKPSPQEVMETVILPLCQGVGLPLSLRMGTHRAICPSLRLAGDGVGSAQLESLARLCHINPHVKFLATVLGRSDQHELTVLASKFRNLHIWGCWWYCNNPSIVSEVTELRMEMLGTGFTFQASSARVHDQLISKWIHSRALLSRALTSKYTDLLSTGWQISRTEIRRDVQRLLGGAFQEFIAK